MMGKGGRERGGREGFVLGRTQLSGAGGKLCGYFHVDFFFFVCVFL